MNEIDVIAALGPDLVERAELSRVAHSLHAEGWSAGITVPGLIADWSQLASSTQFPPSIEEYLDGLTARDAIELALARVGASISERLEPMVAAADSEFQAGTVDDSRKLLPRNFRIDPAARWWWRRIPSAWA